MGFRLPPSAQASQKLIPLPYRPLAAFRAWIKSNVGVSEHLRTRAAGPLSQSSSASNDLCRSCAPTFVRALEPAAAPGLTRAVRK